MNGLCGSHSCQSLLLASLVVFNDKLVYHVTCCLYLMEEITNANDSNKHAVSLFIDLEKYNILTKILLCNIFVE